MKINRIFIIIVIFLFFTFLSSCRSSANQQNLDKNDIPEASASFYTYYTNNDIEDLPNELYIIRESTGNECWAADKQIYTFDIDKTTEFSINTKIVTGELQLSIKYNDSDKYIYDKLDTNNLNDNITLEKGTYCVIISGELYNGYLHIIS